MSVWCPYCHVLVLLVTFTELECLRMKISWCCIHCTHMYTLWNGYKQLFCSAPSSWETACGRNAWAAEISCHWASKPRESSASLKFSLWQQRMNRHHGTTYRTSYETPMECSGQRGDKDWSLEETLWKNCCHRDFTSKCDKIQTLQTLLCIWSAWWHELTWHGWHGTMWYYVIMCMSGSKDSKECSLAELFWTPPCISSPHLFGFWKFDEVCNGCSRCSWHQLTGVTRCSKAP